MDLRKLTRKFVSTSIASALCCVSFSAFADTCTLGQACALSDTLNTNSSTARFVVTPATGANYLCTVNSTRGSLKFFVSGGGHYRVVHGFGFHNADPNVTFEVSGWFKYPNDMNDVGTIKITPLSFDYEGSVVCVARP